MDNPKSLFNTNTKVCENCKSPLPYDYKENLCPRCRQKQNPKCTIWKERSNYSSLLLTFDLLFFLHLCEELVIKLRLYKHILFRRFDDDIIIRYILLT